MTTQQVADKLHEAVVALDIETIHRDLFAANIESIESTFAPMPHAKGIEQVEPNSLGEISRNCTRGQYRRPCIGDFISLGMSFDATLQDGNRMQLSELIVYKVENGKIVLEQFFY